MRGTNINFLLAPFAASLYILILKNGVTVHECNGYVSTLNSNILLPKFF